MYFSTRRMRRSPFMEVRFISPDSTAGRMTCAAWPIWLWMMSTLTENSPPASIAADDGIDQFLAGRPGARVHRLLHHVGAAVVFALEDAGVERGLVVVVGPDVMDLALARDQQLVDIGRGTADMRIRGTHVAFLVAAETADATTLAADVAGRQRDVHQGADGAVVVVAPDDALLIGRHAFAA
jgi:hypothetical protein